MPTAPATAVSYGVWEKGAILLSRTEPIQPTGNTLNTSHRFSAQTLLEYFRSAQWDNGDDRIFPSGVTCGNSGAPACLYTTIPVWQIDEGAKTATLTFHQILPTSLYSFYGGNTEQLANGNVEYDLCAVGGVGQGSWIYEVTQETNPQTVWSMQVTGTNLYRAFRISSLYPGVQW